MSSMQHRLERVLNRTAIQNIQFREDGLMLLFEYDVVECDQSEESPALAFITEECMHFINFISGTSINFSIRNMHSGPLTIYAMEVDLVAYLDPTSETYSELANGVPPSPRGFSAPIMSHAMLIRLSRNPSECRAGIGVDETSAGSRGILSPTDWRSGELKDPRFARQVDLFTPTLMHHNFLPPSVRFVLKRGESDAFHCIATGEEPGIYAFRIRFSFHYDNVKATSTTARVG